MIEEEILNKCKKRFAAHKATLIQDTDRYLIFDWRKADGSSDYYVNYILDKKRGNLIISGDLGDCIATWYNAVSPRQMRSYVPCVAPCKAVEEYFPVTCSDTKALLCVIMCRATSYILPVTCALDIVKAA